MLKWWCQRTVDAEQRARVQLRRCGPNVPRGLAPFCPVLTERKRHGLDFCVAQADVKRARRVEAASCGFLTWLVSYMAACARRERRVAWPRVVCERLRSKQRRVRAEMGCERRDAALKRQRRERVLCDRMRCVRRCSQRVLM